MIFTHILSRSEEFLAKLAEEPLDRFDKLSPRDVRVVQVDILQHSVHPLDLGSLLVLVLLDDHHLWVPLALLGTATILEALEQAVLVPSQLDANLLELPAGDHSIFAVLLVLRIGQVLSAQSANAKLKPTNERKILPVIMPISSVLKISPAEVAVRVDEPGQYGEGGQHSDGQHRVKSGSHASDDKNQQN